MTSSEEQGNVDTRKKALYDLNYSRNSLQVKMKEENLTKILPPNYSSS